MMKKTMTMLLTAAMILSMSVTAFAAEANTAFRLMMIC